MLKKSLLQIQRSQLTETENLANDSQLKEAIEPCHLIDPSTAKVETVDDLKVDLDTEKQGFWLALQDFRRRVDLESLANKHGAFNVRVFGSVVRGEDTPDSDIDLLIDYDLKRISSWFPAGLIVDLEELLGHKVDVVMKKGLHSYIRERVLADAMSL